MPHARVLTVHEACQAQSARGSCRGAQDNTTLQSFNLNYPNIDEDTGMVMLLSHKGVNGA